MWNDGAQNWGNRGKAERLGREADVTPKEIKRDQQAAQGLAGRSLRRRAWGCSRAV